MRGRKLGLAGLVLGLWAAGCGGSKGNSNNQMTNGSKDGGSNMIMESGNPTGPTGSMVNPDAHMMGMDVYNPPMDGATGPMMPDDAGESDGNGMSADSGGATG